MVKGLYLDNKVQNEKGNFFFMHTLNTTYNNTLQLDLTTMCYSVYEMYIYFYVE